MVSMDNIIREHSELDENKELEIRFKSGAISTVKPTDEIEVVDGDLKIIRFFKGDYICTVFFNCADVESFNIHKRELI